LDVDIGKTLQRQKTSEYKSPNFGISHFDFEAKLVRFAFDAFGVDYDHWIVVETTRTTARDVDVLVDPDGEV